MSIKDMVAAQIKILSDIEIEAYHKTIEIEREKRIKSAEPNDVLLVLKDKYAPMVYKMAIADRRVPYDRHGELLDYDDVEIISAGIKLVWYDGDNADDEYFAVWDMVEQWEKQNVAS